MAVTTGDPGRPIRRPGSGVAFDINPRHNPWYRFIRIILRLAVWIWFRPVITGSDKIPATGAVIITPVHRSFADFSFAGSVTPRKLFFMTKDEMWEHPLMGRFLTGVGAFPVHREHVDREALIRAETALRLGQVLVLFPDGSRQEGAEVANLLEGAAYLAARTGAPVVPMGIAGSDEAMPKGKLLPKLLKVHVVLGDPIAAPPRSGSGRVPRTTVRAFTGTIRQGMQDAYDRARELHALAR